MIEAIVIKKARAGEHDQLVTLYTRELGKTVALARSIMKSHSVQALALDEGNHIHCELVPGRGAAIITGAQAMRCFSQAKQRPMRWAAAQFFLQIIDVAVYEHQEDEALFACLASALGALDDAPEDAIMSVFRFWQRRMLTVLGYGAAAQDDRAVDDAYERITQKHLGTLAFLAELANTHFS